MKKVLSILLILAVLVVFSACGSEPTENAEAEPETPDITTMTAEEIVVLLQEQGCPIENIISYTAETDPNELLGRPNQYTSKANFADPRIEQYDQTDPLGGTVEVFENAADAQSRYDYIDAITQEMPTLGYYQYLYENVLLRVEYALTPDQAAEYENAFLAIQQ